MSDVFPGLPVGCFILIGVNARFVSKGHRVVAESLVVTEFDFSQPSVQCEQLLNVDPVEVKSDVREFSAPVQIGAEKTVNGSNVRRQCL